jgi:hypothetical protein
MKKWLSSAAALLALVGQDHATAQAPVAVSGAPVIASEQVVDYGYDSAPRGRFIAEVGFMILTPKWKDNPAFFVSSFDDDLDLDRADQKDFNFHQQFVPKLSLGFAGAGGLGARLNWWGFASSRTESFTIPDPNDDSIAVFPVAPLEIQEDVTLLAFSPGEVVNAHAKLRMDVWDFEAIDQFRAGNWSLLGSLGVRYAHISQRYDADVISVGGEGNADDGSIRSGHNFNGAGPTISLDGRRALGSSSLFLYGNGRASILFGEAKQDAHFFLFNNEFDDTFVSQNTMEANAVISATELELGLGFARDTGRFQLSAKAGFVGQIWYEAGNSSRATGDEGEHLSAPQDNNLGLVGWTLNFGIGY